MYRKFKFSKPVKCSFIKLFSKDTHEVPCRTDKSKEKLYIQLQKRINCYQSVNTHGRDLLKTRNKVKGIDTIVELVIPGHGGSKKWIHATEGNYV